MNPADDPSDDDVTWAGFAPAYPSVMQTEASDGEIVEYECFEGIGQRLYLAVKALPVARSLIGTGAMDRPDIRSIVTLAFRFADELIRQDLQGQESP